MTHTPNVALSVLLLAALVSCSPPPVAPGATNTAPMPAATSPAAGAATRTATGFYWPTARATTDFKESGAGWWLASGCSPDSGYFSGKYHIGRDIAAAVGAPVYAIADGQVSKRSLGGTAHDWGEGNIALLVQHRLTDGTVFTAVYGHVSAASTALDTGDRVTAGQTIGTVGPWSSGDHLHFGIHPGASMPATNYGAMRCPTSQGNNGFVPPIDWITTRVPGPWDTAAPTAVATAEPRPTPQIVPTPTRRPAATATAAPPQSLDRHDFDSVLRWLMAAIAQRDAQKFATLVGTQGVILAPYGVGFNPAGYNNGAEMGRTLMNAVAASSPSCAGYTLQDYAGKAYVVYEGIHFAEVPEYVQNPDGPIAFMFWQGETGWEVILIVFLEDWGTDTLGPLTACPAP